MNLTNQKVRLLDPRYYFDRKPSSIWDNYPRENHKYVDFFNNYAKENYELRELNCLCGFKNDELLLSVDRYGVEYECVICKSCGLIRAKKYMTDNYVQDFYKNHFRFVMGDLNYSSKETFFGEGSRSFQQRQLIEEIIGRKFSKESIIVDLGGGAGGFLNAFSKECDCYIVDYDETISDYAESIGIKKINGGLEDFEKLNICPDLIISNHNIEHWTNFNKEIEILKKIAKKNKTVFYFEVPGLDNVKNGSRNFDFISEIQIPHVFYFTSYVFKNLFERNGFKNIYINPNVDSLFLYTEECRPLENYYKRTLADILKAEMKRKSFKRNFIPATKRLIKSLLPYSVLERIKNHL